MRRSVRPPAPMEIVRLRAIFGLGFLVMGTIIAVRLLFFVAAPPSQKLLGLAFTVVLVALGAVRIRAYLLRRSAGAPP